MAESASWYKLNRACFSVPEDQAECRKTHKQGATERGCSEALAEHLKGENTGFSDVHEI